VLKFGSGSIFLGRIYGGNESSANLHYVVSTCMWWCVQDLPFDDGMPPPDNVVVDWFEVLRSRFTADPTSCVAVHCIAGLGR